MTPTDRWVHDLLEPQPEPTPGGESVTDHAMRQATDPRVIALLDGRRRQGRRRYGCELGADNGRDPMRDLVQELVDALVYARQVEMETEDSTVAKLVEQVLRLAVTKAGWR